MKIWERYFYTEICKTFFFLLFCLFALYVTLDLMAHIKDLRDGQTSIFTWIVYYLCTFSRRLDVLLPFVVLIGSIRILLSFQAQNVLVALLTSGLSLKTVLKPFINASLIAACILFVNYEWVLPIAQPHAVFIQENDFGKKTLTEEDRSVREVRLKDASKMIYQSYDAENQKFEDVFWVASLDKIYHIKTLDCSGQTPEGHMVDLISRDRSGFLQKSASFSEIKLNDMHFDEDYLKNSVILPRDQSISRLFRQMKLFMSQDSDKSADIKTNFFYKLTCPLMSLLAFIAVSPFCVRFTRSIPHFMLYLLAISGLFCFLLLLQVVFVLAKSQFAPAWFAFALPWAAAFYGFSRNYQR
jgi:lipopolysaccharide export system permease protein